MLSKGLHHTPAQLSIIPLINYLNQRHIASTIEPSSPSSFNHIPIVNLIQYYESVSNTSRVSNSPLESIDPRLLPPPSYEEVITNVSNPDEPPPTYMESFWKIIWFVYTVHALLYMRIWFSYWEYKKCYFVI